MNAHSSQHLLQPISHERRTVGLSLATKDHVSQMDALPDSGMLTAICLDSSMAGMQLDAFLMQRAEPRFWKPLLIARIINVQKVPTQKNAILQSFDFRPEQLDGP